MDVCSPERGVQVGEFSTDTEISKRTHSKLETQYSRNIICIRQLGQGQAEADVETARVLGGVEVATQEAR